LELLLQVSRLIGSESEEAQKSYIKGYRDNDIKDVLFDFARWVNRHREESKRNYFDLAALITGLDMYVENRRVGDLIIFIWLRFPYVVCKLSRYSLLKFSRKHIYRSRTLLNAYRSEI